MKKQLFLALVIVLIIAAAVVFIRLSGIGTMLSLQSIQQQRAAIALWTSRHYFMAVLFYIITYSIAGAIAFPGVSLLTIIGGFLFGPIMATLYTIIGATSGAIVIFLMSRYFFGSLVQAYYQQQLLSLHDHLAYYGVFYLLWARLIPILPFFLTNILAGLMPISLLTFIGTTAVGIIPVTFLYASAGQQLMTIKGITDIFSVHMLIIFSLLGLLVLIPVFIKKWL